MDADVTLTRWELDKTVSSVPSITAKSLLERRSEHLFRINQHFHKRPPMPPNPIAIGHCLIAVVAGSRLFTRHS